MSFKTCKGCCAVLPLTQFNINRGTKDGRLSRCRACMKVWRAAHADRLRERDRIRHSDPNWKADRWSRDLQKKYGITAEQYEAMLAGQGGACAICHETSDKKLAVDHCHATNKVRGLLCARCNVGLGMFNDRPGRLRAAIQYLATHHG